MMRILKNKQVCLQAVIIRDPAKFSGIQSKIGPLSATMTGYNGIDKIRLTIFKANLYKNVVRQRQDYIVVFFSTLLTSAL